MSRKKVNDAITNEEERQKERKIERKKERQKKERNSLQTKVKKESQ